ncbi:amidase family protein [Mesorhizobium sp.]|uniref:amidase family protein n=1 Tax=Mesorhizobium sp. TaxID=1871066 RepID=UPI000FE7C184|nr:amidase family protein [Mesorhizobium sp.]RWA97843.1 MAG: glutamyl-tRNA amidotransferase [Mesorhizobium sp.]
MQELSVALVQRDTNPCQLVEQALARAACSPNTFISLRTREVLEEAEQSDVRWREGRPLSSLDGVPIAWKDLIDVQGMITTAGSPAVALDAAITDRDAVVVRNTKRLGLLALGKTNLSELAYSGLNLHFGTPGDGIRVPGGSSSGSAIAVRDGVVAASIGTDTAGSIRIPAALNGLVGFKASPSRYDMSGVFPLASSFDSVGPICRTVADCVTMDAAMRGKMKPNISPASSPPKFVVDMGILEDGVRNNFIGFVERLSDAGAGVENRRVVAVERSRKAFDDIGWLGAAEAYALHKKLLVGGSRELLDPRIVARLEAATSLGAAEIAILRDLRAELIGNIARELGGAILLMPTVKHVAPRLSHMEGDVDLFAKVNLATLSLTMIGSFLNMPGIAVPTGRSIGLATSALLSGAVDSDEGVLSAALWVEKYISPMPTDDLRFRVG